MIQRYIERKILEERQRMIEEQKHKQPCCVHCRDKQLRPSEGPSQQNPCKEETGSPNANYSNQCLSETRQRPTTSTSNLDSYRSNEYNKSSPTFTFAECSCSKYKANEKREPKAVASDLCFKKSPTPAIKHSSKIIANNNEISVVIDDS